MEKKLLTTIGLRMPKPEQESMAQSPDQHVVKTDILLLQTFLSSSSLVNVKSKLSQETPL